jgi:hypothetical protein
MKKLILGVLLTVVVLLLIAVVGVLLFIDPIAKAGVERGATYALGVDTTVKKLSLGLTSGELTMDELHVANPVGFQSPHLMKSGQFDLKLRPGSILEDTIELNKFELNGLDVHIDQKVDGSNVSVILDNLKRLGGDGEGKGEEKEEPAEGKKVKVDRIVVTNVVAHFHLLSDLHKGGPLTVKVPRIELNDVTSDDADGVVVSELVARILPAVLAAVLDKAQGVVPSDFLTVLNGDLDGVTKALGGEVEKLTRQVHKEFEKVLGGEAGKILDANGAAGDVKKTVGGVLEGLIGGKKNDNK